MFKFLYLTCVIFLMGQHHAVAILDPGYEYVQEADAWLRLHIVPVVWADARTICQLEGGVLASPSTDAITQAMISQMIRHKVMPRNVFTGIHAHLFDLDFTSLDGVRLSKINLDWAPNEPNDDENEEVKCVVLNGAGQVSDVNCNVKHPYFCRKESGVMNATSDCPTTDKGYKYEPLTGSCYKLHRYSQSWNRAARVCHAEGGHLAIINNNIEAKVLKDILEKNPVETILEAKHIDVALIGFWKWEDINNEWSTIHGETLEKAGYAQWSDGVDRHSLYGAIQRSGLLDAVAKYDRDPFICEIMLD